MAKNPFPELFILPKRLQLLKIFSFTILFFSFVVRVVLYFLSIEYLNFSVFHLIKIFFLGFLFDIGSLTYLLSIYAIYLLIVPTKFHGKKIDRIFQKFSFGLFMFIYIFSFLAEIPFWQEYQRRYNFIAVDYLLYTYEVIENIHQSFPLPLLIGLIVLILYLCIRYASKKGAYKSTFNNSDGFLTKLYPSLFIFITFLIFHFFVDSDYAEFSPNNNENELSKSGVYAFFAAYKSNELNYNEFYKTIPKDVAFQILKTNLKNANSTFINDNNGILRIEENFEKKEEKPNVIFIGLESMSGSFLKKYGNKLNLTPAIDSLQNNSIAFTNLYATGTRTIRGLESVSLSLPPTPGRSIVKRKNNENLFNIGEVFKQKGYSRSFIYGGDSHFDNMLYFFSNNGFDIIDRKKNFRINNQIPTQRVQIEDKDVTFENAWGACDEDIYNATLRNADLKAKSKKPFFFLMMTSSNHHPYTFSEGIINSNEKTRNNAVKYSDKTFERFFEKAKSKPWFKNTVFVVMADHCSYSAGRTELNIKNHHIPAFIFNLKNVEPQEVDKLSSQIDIFPTLFGYLNWSYQSNLYGLDINKMEPHQERAFIANHRKVGLYKNKQLIVLETKKKFKSYNVNIKENSLLETKTESSLLYQAISYYQTAFDLFKNNKLKVTNTTQK